MNHGLISSIIQISMGSSFDNMISNPKSLHACKSQRQSRNAISCEMRRTAGGVENVVDAPRMGLAAAKKADGEKHHSSGNKNLSALFG